MKTKSFQSAKINELLLTYNQNPSVELRNRLVILNAGLVRKIAKRLYDQCPEQYEDLEQIGFLGLISAIERFNPKRGASFSSFAVLHIQGAIQHYLRDRSNTVRIPRRFQDLYYSAQKTSRALICRLGRFPSDTEIKAELNIPETEWQEAKIAASNRSLTSLDTSIKRSGDKTNLTLLECIPDNAREELDEAQIQVREALAKIDQELRVIIEQVYFRGMTRQQVAERMNTSPMTIGRRVKSGIRQLTNLLEQQKAS